MAPKKKKSSFNRQYQENDLKFGVFVISYSHTPSLLYIICGDRLSSEAMKPSKLLRHLKTKQNKPLEYFERKNRTGAITEGLHSELFREAVVKKITRVPLWASTVTWCIAEIAEDIETQLLAFKTSYVCEGVFCSHNNQNKLKESAGNT